MRRVLFLMLATLLALPMVAGTHTPVGRCDYTVSFGVIEIGVGIEEATFYLDDRNEVTGSGWWLYMESNGMYDARGDAAHNLQRGGSAVVFPRGPDICWDTLNITPDTLIL